MVDMKYAKFMVKRLIGPHLKRYAREKQEFLALRQTLPAFLKEKSAGKGPVKRALFVSYGAFNAKVEALYLKALEAVGYHPCVVTLYDPYVSRIYALYGIDDVTYYENYFKKVARGKCLAEAKSVIRCGDEARVLTFEKNGIRVGEFAASSYMRRTRASGFEKASLSAEGPLLNLLAFSLVAAYAADDIVGEIRPDLVFVMDRGYSPYAQLFDACLKRGIPVIARSAAHKSGWEMLKRYTSPETALIHPHTLSPESWDYIKTMPWDEGKGEYLYQELSRTYMSGDWYAEGGTQFNKKMYSRDDLSRELHLDVYKKTAVIFPHMFWDASFFYGKDLFRDYYDWFVNVLRVAAENTSLNWIIKVHPANVVKAKRDKYFGEHKELLAVYEALGDLPEHMKVISPESDINTFSLFGIMDYCLTVRGTVGIEASAMGINTLTAGTGRYDNHGFTHDFTSREAYLSCLRSLDEMPPMTEESTELARRFAYGIFEMRPIHFDLLDFGYNQDEKATMRFFPLFKNRDEFESSTFVRTLREYVVSGQTDYLIR
jgi:hypothetical protein